MDPVYFLDKATYAEIGDYLEGVAERSRESWEQTRLLSFIVARVGGCDADSVEEFLPLPWDKEDEDIEKSIEVDPYELRKLREKAKQIERELKDGRYTM